MPTILQTILNSGVKKEIFLRNFKIKKVEVFFVRSYRNWSFALGVNDENHGSRKIIISLRDL